MIQALDMADNKQSRGDRAIERPQQNEASEDVREDNIRKEDVAQAAVEGLANTNMGSDDESEEE
jgi:hypothetical protein